LGFLLVYFVVPERRTSVQEKKPSVSFIQSFKNVWQDRKMKGILYYIVGRGFYRWGFNSFFPIYAMTMATLSKSQVGLVISSYMITGTLLQYPFGRLADRLPKRRATLVAVGGGIAAITTFIVPLITQMSWLVVLVIIMGIFSALSRASTVAIRTEQGRIHGMGAVTGAFTAGFSAGQVLGPVGFGVITDVWSIPASFYVGAFVGLLTTGLAFWYLWKKSEQKKSPVFID